MGIQATFGTRGRTNNANSIDANGEMKKAQYWLNFGYVADTIVEGEDEPRFVSLPVGIPLDTMERLNTRSSNQMFAQFQAARNNLLDEILANCKTLEPGNSLVLPLAGEGGLAVQIRRVNAEQTQPSIGNDNPFARSLEFHAAA